MQYHGNYCGPYWSGGKRQASVIDSNVPAIDDFDETCREHDGVYALPTVPSRRSAADWKFYNANIGRGVKRSLAAMAVGGQAVIRDFAGVDLSAGEGGGIISSSKKIRLDEDISEKKMARGKVKYTKGKGKKSYSKKTKKSKRSQKKIAKKRSYKKTKKFVKKYVKKSFAKYSVASIRETVESRGVVNDGRCVYLGHSLAGGPIVRAICRSIVKELLRQAGNHVDDFAKVIANNPPYAIMVTFRSSPESDSILTSIFTTVGGNTYEQLATGLRTLFQDIALNHPNGILDTITLNKIDNAGETDYDRFAYINCMEFRASILVTSVLKIQNETRGVVGQDEYDAEAVTRNPLMYRGYACYGKNGFTPRVVPGTEVGYEGTFARDDNGLIRFSSLLTLNRYSRKLLPLKMMNAKKHGYGVIAPGQIKRDINKMMLKFTFYKFWEAFQFSLKNPTTAAADTTPYVKGMKAQMIGFEKVVDTGTAAALQLGFELEQTYAANYYIKKSNYTAPVLNIG